MTTIAIFFAALVTIALIQFGIVRGLMLWTTRYRSVDETKRVLIVRLDGIGDYILFRNFLEAIKRSRKYGDCKITLVGNILFRNLALPLDSQTVDEFIWIDPAEFRNKWRYRRNMIRLLRERKYEVAINPHFTRHALIDDSIIHVVHARDKIGFRGDDNGIGWQKWIADRWYTSLENNTAVFEFDRTLQFFQKILTTDRVRIDRPRIECNAVIPRYRYAIMCPCAGDPRRRWMPEKFFMVADNLYREHGIESILVGSYSESLRPDERNRVINTAYIHDLIGTLSLTETCQYLDGATICVTNDTCVAHMAVAVDCQAVVVSNGNTYGRFTEYPERIYRQIRYVYSPGALVGTFDERVERFRRGSDLSINDVLVCDVMGAVDELLGGAKC